MRIRIGGQLWRQYGELGRCSSWSYSSTRRSAHSEAAERASNTYSVSRISRNIAFVKMYILSDDGHVITRANLYCGGVQQAKELAKALVDAKPVELWKGLIRLERFEPTH